MSTMFKSTEMNAMAVRDLTILTSLMVSFTFRVNISSCLIDITNILIIYTLWAEMFEVGDFWLETRVIIKILTHPP